MAKNTITGGGFIDPEGNPLSNGYLTLELSVDCQTPDPAQLFAGIKLKVSLDASGNVAGTVLIWPNDLLTPTGSYYIVNAHRADGVKVWAKPHNLQILSSPSPFNIGAWVPS